MKDTFITYEQAVKHNSLEQTVDQYKIQIQQMLRFFQKNTVAQFMAHGFYMELLDLSIYFNDKDYSKMLFDKIEHAFKEFESNKPKLEQLGEQFTQMAQTISAAEFKNKKPSDEREV